MNVLIIEDEKPAARRLNRMLAALNIEVQQMLHSVEESLNWLQNNEHPDLIFLDIEMPGENGFKLFEYFEKLDFDVIFSTAFDKYAIEAIKHSALDYILKPINTVDLAEIIKKFEKTNKKDIKKALIETQFSLSGLLLHIQSHYREVLRWGVSNGARHN